MKQTRAYVRDGRASGCRAEGRRRSGVHEGDEPLSHVERAATTAFQPVIEATIVDRATGDSGRGNAAFGGISLDA